VFIVQHLIECNGFVGNVPAVVSTLSEDQI
jgi:hypothetical protein